MVTADQIDPNKLKIECQANGDAPVLHTDDFIFNTVQMVITFSGTSL